VGVVVVTITFEEILKKCQSQKMSRATESFESSTAQDLTNQKRREGRESAAPSNWGADLSKLKRHDRIARAHRNGGDYRNSNEGKLKTILFQREMVELIISS
jgi:hypothetical protein